MHPPFWSFLVCEFFFFWHEMFTGIQGRISILQEYTTYSVNYISPTLWHSAPSSGCRLVYHFSILNSTELHIMHLQLSECHISAAVLYNSRNLGRKKTTISHRITLCSACKIFLPAYFKIMHATCTRNTHPVFLQDCNWVSLDYITT